MLDSIIKCIKIRKRAKALKKVQIVDDLDKHLHEQRKLEKQNIANKFDKIFMN